MSPLDQLPASGVADSSQLGQDAGDRGSTTLATRVVEKIASQAALEVAHTGGLQRQLAGRGLGTSTVRSRADVDGTLVSLALDLAVDYPQPIRAVTRAVRVRVASQVQRLCGLQVARLDITVAVLQKPDTERRYLQ